MRAALQALVPLVLASAIATVGMLIGGEATQAQADLHDSEAAALPEGFAQYPGANAFSMGSRVRVGGEEMKLAYFATRDSPLRVAEYYGRVWEAKGLVVTRDVTPDGGMVGAVDPALGAMALTLVRREGRTFGFASRTRSPIRMLAAGDLTAGGELALYPGSDGALRFVAEDEGRDSEVLSYGNWAGLRDNVDYYRREMARRGWREQGSTAPPELAGQRTLRFTRRDERADVSIAPMGQGGRVRVLVTRTRGW